MIELRDGESFALAGLIRKDFQDTVRQVPMLGSLPIIGSLFRSTGFQREETELVIIVTPRLVAPVRAGALKAPTDRVGPPTPARPVPQRADGHRSAAGRYWRSAGASTTTRARRRGKRRRQANRF